jgi:hypothetical protein
MSERRRRVLVGVGTMFIVLTGALGAFFYFYVARQTAYLQGHYLRELALAATMIQESQATVARVVKTKNETDKTKKETDGTTKESNQRKPIDWRALLKASTGQTHSVLQLFDVVLLVNSDGDVLAQQPEAALRIETLKGRIQVDRQDKANELSFAAATAIETVRLAGTDYRLFVRPLSVESDKPAIEGDTDHHLRTQAALCGLVSADAFRTRTWSLVSWSRLFIFASALILVGWPFLKTSMVADTARITRVDVAMVGVCGLVGLALFVILVFDFYLYSRLNADIDVALQRFSQEIRDRSGVEIRDAYAQMEALELQMLARNTPDQSTDRDKLMYPYFLSVSLITSKGRQDRKTWAGAAPVPAPHVDVSDRTYFSASRDNQQLWTVTGKGADQPARMGPLYIESVRSWQTGKTQAAIAKPTASSGEFVATAIGMSMRSLIDPVAIPGFEFAVVDRSGLVLFHSDSQRNGSEQFFSATELDHRLMEAVTTETQTLLTLTYRAQEHRAFVAPFNDAPWSLVTLYGQEDAEALNLEWLTTTLALLALYFVWLIGGSLIILHAGRRHLRHWLWPNVDRAWSYRRALSYFAWLTILMAVAIYGCSPGQLIVVLATLPVAVWVAVALAGANSRTPRWVAAPAAKLIGRWLSDVTPRTTYAIAVCLLAGLAAVLPAVAAMKIAFTVRTTAFVQKMQLELAVNARDRQRRDASEYPTVSRPDTINRYDSFFYGSCADTVPHATAHFEPGAPGNISADTTIVRAMMSVFSFMGLGTFVRHAMPEGAANGSWDAHLSVFPAQTAARGLGGSWCRSRASGDLLLTLHSWAPAAFPFEDSLMRFESRLPSMFELRASVAPLDSSASNVSGTAVNPAVIDSRGWMLLWLAIGAITLLLLTVWVVRFFCRYVLLFGIPEGGWKDEVPRLLPNDDSNLYVVCRSERNRARFVDRETFAYLSFQACDAMSGAIHPWLHARLLEIDRVMPGRTVLLDHFEHRLDDSMFTLEKIAFLDVLVRVHRRRVLVVSTVSSAAAMAHVPEITGAVAATGHLSGGSWGMVLNGFVVVDLEACADASAIPATVEGLGRAAPAHYAALWESSSPRERIVLGHLARFGFVNSKAIGTLRHLWLRGLVKLDPAPRLMSDAFERYVLSSECRRDVDVAVANTAADSSWTALRTPLLLVMVSAFFFLAITQRDLLDMKAVVAGVTASLTPLLKEVISQVISRRSAAAS